MRADRPSLTATLVAGVRAMYAAFPDDLRVAADPEAAALLPPLLAAPAAILQRAPWLAPALHHAVGVASVGLSWHVALRTLAIDDALRDAIRDGASQIVLLGAGLDNRAARLPEAAAVRVFEVDHPNMQRYKRARLEGARRESGSQRVFVPVDFERDRLDTALEAAGFSPALVTFWIWEGVTAYLTHGAIEATLRMVAENSAAGSLLSITYVQPPQVLGHTIDRMATFLGRLVGEPLFGRYDQSEMAALLRGFGFAVQSDEADTDLAARYWKDSSTAYPRALQAFPEWERLALAERIQG